MDSNKTLEDIRNWFNEQHAVHGWSYASLARIDTGYKSESGLKKALKEKTIKYDALMVLINEKGLKKEFEREFNIVAKHHKSDGYNLEVTPELIDKILTDILLNNIELTDLQVDIISGIVATNEDTFFKNKKMKNIRDLKVSKKLLEISQSKEALMNFLKD